MLLFCVTYQQVFGSVLLKSSEKVDADWRKAVVTAMVNSLSEQKCVTCDSLS